MDPRLKMGESERERESKHYVCSWQCNGQHILRVARARGVTYDATPFVQSVRAYISSVYGLMLFAPLCAAKKTMPPFITRTYTYREGEDFTSALEARASDLALDSRPLPPPVA